MPQRDILVIIPTYNEAENVETAIQRVLAVLPDVDIMIVDDGSPDGTGEIVRRISANDDRVSLMERTGKRGLGPAYLDGFAHGMASGHTLLIEMDADGSHPASALPAMLAAIRSADSVGGVIGSRWVTGGAVVDWPKSRRLISRGGSTYARVMLGLKVRDVTAGFRVYKASALQAIELETVQSQGYCFQIDMTRRMAANGFGLVEVPITFKDRVAGTSKMSKAIVVEAMLRVTIWGFERLVGKERGRRESRDAERVVEQPSAVSYEKHDGWS